MHQDQLIAKILKSNPEKNPTEIQRMAHESKLFKQYESGKIDTDAFFIRLRETLSLRSPVKELKQAWGDIFSPITPMIAWLPALSARYRLVLLSNTNPLHIARCEAQFDFLDRFAFKFYSYELGCMKPDRKIYQMALEKIGQPGESCLFIDDKQENVRAAEQLGMTGVHFTGVENFKNAWLRRL